MLSLETSASGAAVHRSAGHTGWGSTVGVCVSVMCFVSTLKTHRSTLRMGLREMLLVAFHLNKH